MSGGATELAVVASGWRPPREAEEATALQEQQLRQLELQRRGGGQIVLRREQLRLANRQRMEAIEQIRRENDQVEERAAAAQLGDAGDEPIIAGVVPGAGTVSAIVGGPSNGVAGITTAAGEVKWRSSLPEGELAAAHGAGDYLAVQIDASRLVLSVLDLDDGSQVAQRVQRRRG